MDSVSIDALRGIDHMNFLKAVYSERRDISTNALRMKLARRFRVTADNKTMLRFSLLLPRLGLVKRLRSKTVPGAAAAVAILHISPFLDELYEAISENPSITVQGLSDLFVADYGKFFDCLLYTSPSPRDPE